MSTNPKKADYAPPFSATVFRLLGCVTLFGAMLVLGSALLNTPLYPGGSAASFPGFLLALGGALVCFGLDHTMNLVGRLVFQHQLALEVMQRQVAALSAGTNAGVAALTRIAEHIKCIASAPDAAPFSSAGAGYRVASFYYLDLDLQLAGPVSGAELQQLFEEGRLESDSLVRGERDRQWLELERVIPLD